MWLGQVDESGARCLLARHPHTRCSQTRCSANLLARCQPAATPPAGATLTTPPLSESSLMRGRLSPGRGRLALRVQHALNLLAEVPLGHVEGPGHRRAERHLDGHHHAAGLEGVDDPAEASESDGLVADRRRGRWPASSPAASPPAGRPRRRRSRRAARGPPAGTRVRRRVNVSPKPHIDRDVHRQRLSVLPCPPPSAAPRARPAAPPVSGRRSPGTHRPWRVRSRAVIGCVHGSSRASASRCAGVTGTTSAVGR